jgi:ABC-type nitrate/sulfonate/bicarbonate transport system substrate-binding protein
MKTLRIGGVPEHFNMPWHRLTAAGALPAKGVDATWQDYPGGTGAMISALEDEAIDVALLLTEGAVLGVGKGGRFRIVSLYTESPLIWGIHVPADSRFETIEAIRGARYAISRYGSGSHLMSYAHARALGWPAQTLRFEVVGTLDGAVNAFAAGRADVFLWEKFMTKPLVDSGRFRRIGEFAAPWPAFVVAASERVLADRRPELALVLRKVFDEAAAFQADPKAPDAIAARFGLDRADAVEWLAETRWARRIGVDTAVLDEVAGVLHELGLLAQRQDRIYTAAL